MRQAGEVVLTKPTTDVVLSGRAHAPEGEAATDWWTEVGVRGRDFGIAQGAHVLGPNRWRFAGRHGWVLERPEAVTQVPIRYDLAFGGAYRAQRARAAEEEGVSEWVTWEQNPYGSGFLDEDNLDDERQYAAPQWLPDESCVGRTRDVGLAGYGPVARPWPTRLKYAGTYDEEWLEKARKSIRSGRLRARLRSPLLPMRSPRADHAASPRRQRGDPSRRADAWRRRRSSSSCRAWLCPRGSPIKRAKRR